MSPTPWTARAGPAGWPAVGRSPLLPRRLIIDEIGWLPIERLGANLFFRLIGRRLERGPMILTSNRSLAAWGDVFGDRVIAIVDRLPHPAVTLNIRGNPKLRRDMARTSSE